MSTVTAGSTATDICPKHMVHGPCGGVLADGGCEVDHHRCPFLDHALVRWDGPVADRSTTSRQQSAPLVICDVRPAEPTLSAVRATGELHRFADVVLVGDHHETVDLPGAIVAAELVEVGLEPWVTLSCRDRNRVALEADLVALRELGVRTAHCVTGDARAPHVRPGSPAVFDLDSHQLVALATSLGLTGSVAETPTAPPLEHRADRAAEKHRAGASWCFVNLTTRHDVVRDFVGALQDRVPELHLVICVAVFTDPEGVGRLRALPGVDLADDTVAMVLGDPDPVAAGIRQAATAARAALELPGVHAVNLTGPASSRGPVERAAVLSAVAEQLR